MRTESTNMDTLQSAKRKTFLNKADGHISGKYQQNNETAVDKQK